MLKIGDTFEDGGVLHKVIGQNDSGLICQVIDGDIVKPKEEAVEEVVDEPKQEEDELDTMLYSQLKKLCAEKGLDAKGSKADLIERLRG